jgi:hypothetical protein
MKLFLLFAIICACSAPADEEFLKKSMEIHDLAVQIGEKVDSKLTVLESKVRQLEEPYRSQVQDSIIVLRSQLLEWEQNLVEIPGHEKHDHSGHKHYHRNSSEDLQLTPEMMLKVQKVIRDRIIRLNVHTQNILTIIDAYENDKSIKKEEKTASYGT